VKLQEAINKEERELAILQDQLKEAELKEKSLNYADLPDLKKNFLSFYGKGPEIEKPSSLEINNMGDVLITIASLEEDKQLDEEYFGYQKELAKLRERIRKLPYHDDYDE